jgi:hypothetical protein
LRVVAVSDSAVTLALELGKLRSIEGIARDEDGDVIMDARVFAVREHEGEDSDPRGRPRLSDMHGRYSFDDLPAATYSLVAYRHGGGVARRQGVVAGARGVDLVFPQTGRISGRVHTADGAAAQGYVLFVEGGAQQDRPGFPVASSDGRFAASGLEAGRYTLNVMAPTGDGEAVIDLAAGEHRSGIEITLEPRAVITGRLVDGEQRPLVGWAAALREPGMSEDRPPAVANITLTDERGRFRLVHAVPRAWDLLVLPGARSLFPPHMDLADPQWRTPALMVVTPTGGETLELGDLIVDPAD